MQGVMNRGVQAPTISLFREFLEKSRFPHSNVDMKGIGLQLANTPKDKVWDLLCEAAEIIGLPATIINIDGKPFLTPGVVGGLAYHTDCLLQNDAEASGRIQGVAASCWGPARQGLIPIQGEIVRGSTEAFNPDALSFSLASFLARHRLSQDATGNTPPPLLWIGNAAVRDEKHPTGVEFYLAHLQGNVVAVVSGLRALSDVIPDVIGNQWRIDIKKVIDIFTHGVDTETHFRSQFLDAAAYLWAKGHDVLAESIDLIDVPRPPTTIIENERIVTTVAHCDAFDNIKLRLRASEIALLGWQSGDHFAVTINGHTHDVILNGAIADGDGDTLIMTEGSTWHGVPRQDGSVDPYIDIFWNKRPARELFRNNPIHKNQHGLPLSGDEVLIERIK